MKPLNRKPIVDQVVESLVDYIKEEDIQEGTKLPPEITLSERLAVGRGTIREALRVLNTQGYVTLIPGRGAFVASKEPSLSKWFQTHEFDLRNIQEVRRAVEPLAVSLAIENCRDEDVALLHENLDEAEYLIARKDHDKIAVNDAKFHALIASMSKNSLLISINNNIEKYLSEFRMRTFLFENNRRNFYPAHKKIVKAFDLRDEELGRKNMLEHLDVVDQDLEKSKTD
jgi:GntR family transcriptional repressor for pyruvate dehydrogenase complex